MAKVTTEEVLSCLAAACKKGVPDRHNWHGSTTSWTGVGYPFVTAYEVAAVLADRANTEKTPVTRTPDVFRSSVGRVLNRLVQDGRLHRQYNFGSRAGERWAYCTPEALEAWKAAEKTANDLKVQAAERAARLKTEIAKTFGMFQAGERNYPKTYLVRDGQYFEVELRLNPVSPGDAVREKLPLPTSGPKVKLKKTRQQMTKPRGVTRLAK